MTTSKKMVWVYLTVHELDGLYNEGKGCSCFTGDLAPCGAIQVECKGGDNMPCRFEYCLRPHINGTGR